MSRNKYHVAPAAERTFDGRVYHSKAEMIRASELWTALKGGGIRWIIEQPTFRLGCNENVYRPDFLYQQDDGQVIVEDVKGVETAKFKRDKRLWAKYGPLPLSIVKRSGKKWKFSSVEIDNA